MTDLSGITTRPLYDSTDSLLRFAMRADATLTGLCGLAIAFVADPLSSLTGLTSLQVDAVTARPLLDRAADVVLRANPLDDRCDRFVAEIRDEFSAVAVDETNPLCDERRDGLREQRIVVQRARNAKERAGERAGPVGVRRAVDEWSDQAAAFFER